jgi:methionyl-tRNA formyltransferase
MKICFMGTPSFAQKALASIINAGFNVNCVYTKEPKPIGRGHKLALSETHEFANSKNIKVLTPKTLKNTDVQNQFIEEKYGVSKENMIFVTDALGDVRDASVAGVPTVAVIELTVRM